jgi:hypothetical protein
LKKLAVLGAAVALSVMTAPLAYAADDPANCADAITALQRADSDHRAAVAADEALADAVAAGERLEDAQDERDDAQLGVAPLATEASAKDRRDEVRRLLELEEDDPGFPTGEARAALEREETRLNRYIEAEQDLTRAKSDADADVVALRRKADDTNAAALKTALDDARTDFNRICIDEDDPTDDVTTTPATPAPAPDVDVTVVTPRGGVATGGGPA